MKWRERVSLSRYRPQPFEDAPNGVESALAVGMKCVVVPDGSQNGQTTHVDELGVYLWSNAHAHDPRPLRPIDPDTPVLLLSNLPQMKALLDELTESAEEE